LLDERLRAAGLANRAKDRARLIAAGVRA